MASREHQCKSAVDKPLYYTLLRETGVLPSDSPPRLKALRMAGQLSPAQLVDKHPIQSPSIRRPLTTYLAARSAEVDYLTLIPLAPTPRGPFWPDPAPHPPGLDPPPAGPP